MEVYEPVSKPGASGSFRIPKANIPTSEVLKVRQINSANINTEDSEQNTLQNTIYDDQGEPIRTAKIQKLSIGPQLSQG